MRSYQRPASGATITIGTVAGISAMPANAGSICRFRISTSGKISPRPISAIPAMNWLSVAPR